MTQSYLVPTAPVRAEIVERRSRFLATLTRVEDEQAAREVVDAARREHRDARHHCSAFVLGPPGEGVERAADDGEPAGTAGAPMLEVLRGAGVGETAVVVTRWFGGTLLGAGGLVRAYGDAVRAALGEARLVERRRVELLDVAVGHEHAARLEHDLRALGVAVLDVAYAADVRLRLGVAPADRAGVAETVAAVTGGAVEPESAGSAWV